MCGFIYQQTKNKFDKREKALFYSASKLIYNRGPDNQNYFFSKNKKVFHARLKIIDLNDRSNQPFSKNGYSIIYNGEIYNYKILKDELKKYYKIKTNSDTEILLLSFLKWGKNMFSKIEGMFSFIIYNSNNKEFFFARDLFGQKPLYYFIDSNQIIFASEIKPILKLLKKKTSLNDKEIYKYLNFNYHSDDKETFFKNIFQVKPGFWGEYKNNQLTFKKINFCTKINKINEKKLLEIIVDEVKKHLISDVDIAVLISEGVDSRSLLDLSNTLIKKKLKLFNLDFELFDNSDFKNLYNKKIKNDIFYTKLFKKDFFRLLNKTSKICETPPVSLFTVGMFKLFEKIKKQKIKVVLTGQGVDEVFGGYNDLYNKSETNSIYHPDGSKLSISKNFYKKKLFEKKSLNINDRKIKLAFKTKIPKNLNDLDKISMYHSVECRSPYISNIFGKMIDKINLKQMLFKGNLKYIFRKVLFSFTKNKFYFNKKRFKQTPQKEFLHDPKIIKKIDQILKLDNYCDRYFNKKLLFLYYKQFKNNNNNGFILWQYLSLNSFCNNFYKDQPK